jgi:hypothetical protein
MIWSGKKYKRRDEMDAQKEISREGRIRDIAELIYCENRKKGLPCDPERDWKEAEGIYDDKLTYFLFWKPGCFIRKYFYKLIAACVLLIVFFLTMELRVGRNFADWRNRPYLSADLIDPVEINEPGDGNTYFGSYAILKNNGETPAANVTISYYLTSDADGNKAAGQKWLDKRAEGISTLGFVAPRGSAREPSFRSLSPAASYYYFEAVASYYGLNPGKKYWTHIKRVFKIDRAARTFIPVLSYSEWDKGRNLMAPALSTDKDIRTLLAKIEKR